MSRVLPGIVAGIVYLAAALAYVIAVDSNYEADRGVWVALLAGASLALGWVAGSWRAALLAVVLAPLATQFGYPESRFSEPFPTWHAAAIATPISAGLILLGVWARKMRGRRRERAVGPRV